MISIAAVAISVLFAIAVTLASPEKFADNLKRSRILTPVLCVDVVFMAANLILTAMSLQLIPTVKCIAAMVLTVVTVFTALIGVTCRTRVYVLAGFLSAVFVFTGLLFIPAYHGVEEIGETEYAVLGEPPVAYIGTLDRGRPVAYHKTEFPLVVQKERAIVEDEIPEIGSVTK